MAIKLRQAGIDNFLILEKANSLGGTWRENTYPGAECDVGSSYYSYSFALNPDWDHKWSKQKQILAYLKKCASDYGLNNHFKFNKKITTANFDENTKLWTLKSEDGESYQTRFFIPAIGQLHEPNIPRIDGIENFSGNYFHSAQWQHEVELKNKSVAVIGNAASAVQLIPEIAQEVKQLSIYQRSANWILPKGDRPFTRFEKWLAKRSSVLTKFQRLHMWALGEIGVLPTIKGSKIHRRLATWYAQYNMRKHIKNSDLQKALTPNYTICAKRVLLTDNYYPALTRENVELVTEHISSFEASGITDKAGQYREHDVIVFATGFKTNPFLASLDIIGINGISIREHWKHGAYAYNGVLTHNFPNMFMLYGPNTNTGHTSVIYFHEVQSDYIVRLMQKTQKGSISIKAEVEQAFDKEMQARLANTVWATIEASWYKEGERIPNNWPGSTLEYKKRLKKPNWDNFGII